MNIVLLGSPASGKGTQAELLAKKFGLYILATGDLSRKIAETNSRIREIVNSGKLIPEEEMTMYVFDFLIKTKPDFDNILFEGFPRFVSQYQALDNFLATKHQALDLVISLDISRVEAIKRISARRVCASCGEVYNLVTKPSKITNVCDLDGGSLILRPDDEPKSVAVRFDYYIANTKELIDFLDKNHKLIRVSGERPIETISAEINQIIENYGQN